MKVDLPTPGTPEMPMRKARQVAVNSASSKASARRAWSGRLDSIRVIPFAMASRSLARTPAPSPTSATGDALMTRAMPPSGARSKREAVELGLRTRVKLQQQAEIRAFRGRLAWDGDLDAQRLDAGMETAEHQP